METPEILSSSYQTRAFGMNAGGLLGQLQGKEQFDLAAAIKNQQLAAQGNPNIVKPEPQMSTSRRIVKVFIADVNENIPMEKCLLYSGQEQFTEATDQELFFEVPITDLLKKHNDFRVTVIDKKQAEKFGRDIMLEPAKIRDLKMVVVNIAAF